MISMFRNFAKSPWAIGLLVLVALSLLVTGAQMDVFSSLGPKHVITAGDRSVDAARFRVDLERVRTNVGQQAGRPVSMQDMVDENIHIRYLDEQTRNLGFLNWAWKTGVRPGKDLIVREIRKIPAFFNQVTGQFDQQTYEQALARQNILPTQLEQEFRDQYTTNHVGSGVFAGIRMPRVYGALLAGRALEMREGRWFTVTQAMAGTAPAPTDAQLMAYMNENAEQLRRPEFRMVSLVLFNDARDAGGTIAEAQIVERFNFRKDALSIPERRTFVTLTAPSKAVADRIAADLRAGKTPDEAGQAAGNISPAPFEATPKAGVSDPAIADAVFGLQSGQVSDPVQARVGFAVIKLLGISQATPATLESARQAIISELQAEAATGQVFSRVERYEKARADGKTLQQAVAEVGARLVELPPFTEDGRLPDGQPLNAPPQVLTSAYTLSKDGESEVIDAGQGQYFALRLNDILPSALPELADVRAPLSANWTTRENARLLSAKADELAGKIRGGQDIAAVAATVGATVTRRDDIQQNPQIQAEVGQGVLQGLFGQAKGQVFSGQSGDASFVIGRVDDIRAASPVLAAPIAEQVRFRMVQETGNAIVEAVIAAGAAKSKAKNDPEAAIQALGVTPSAAPEPTPTPATP